MSVAVRADVIVVGAGASSRMGGTDKLAVEIAGRPLLAWTLEALAASAAVGRIVVVTSDDRRAEMAAAPWLPAGVLDVVAGGARHIDKELDVSVTRVLQTVAGRMIFAQPRLD